MKYNKQDLNAICISALFVFALSFLYSDVDIERRVLICVLFALVLFVGKSFANGLLKRNTGRTRD
jgi:hypothetical protein